jgi:hypothetical protein
MNGLGFFRIIDEALAPFLAHLLEPLRARSSGCVVQLRDRAAALFYSFMDF